MNRILLVIEVKFNLFMERIQYFAVYYLSNSFAFSKVFFSSGVKDAKPRSFILSKIRSTSFSFKSVVLKLTLYSLSRGLLGFVLLKSR